MGLKSLKNKWAGAPRSPQDFHTPRAIYGLSSEKLPFLYRLSWGLELQGVVEEEVTCLRSLNQSVAGRLSSWFPRPHAYNLAAAKPTGGLQPRQGPKATRPHH